MIDIIRKAVVAFLDPGPSRDELRKRIGRLDSRVSLVASDLDCEVEGSIAAELGSLHQRLNDLDARLSEWVPTTAEKTAQDEGLRTKGKRR